MEKYVIQFDEIIKWAEAIQKQILEEGEEIPYFDGLPAAFAGIENIDKIRILKVDKIVLPDIELVNDLKKSNIFATSSTLGIALGHAILLDKNATRDVMIHEFRHIAQYELFGDLKSYLTFYLRELITFGYGDGPLENDAINFTKRFAK